MSSPQEKALLPRQTVILDTRQSQRRPSPEVVAVGKLHSGFFAARVHGFVLTFEPCLNENSEHPHWKNTIK